MSTPLRTKLGFALLPAVVIGWLPMLQAAPDTHSFSEVTQVTAVEIPVQVVRDGEPVKGLTAKDFEVKENRKTLPIVGFDMVDLGAPGANTTKAVAQMPAAARRHFLLLFDLSNSEPRSLVLARSAATDLVNKSMTPSDLVAVATFATGVGPRLVLNFTTDRRQVARAVDHLGLSQLVDRNPDPLKVMADDFAASFSSSAPKGKHDADILETLQDLQKASQSANHANQAQVVSAFARSFADLGKLMASVNGRKEVIYLSEGFDASVLQGETNVDSRDQMSDDAMHGDIGKVDSDVRFGNTHQDKAIDTMLESFRRSDCVVQAIDIGGVRAGGGANVPGGRSSQLGASRAGGDAALFQMAHDTGGELYQNFNDLNAAMGQLMHKTSVTYVLTVQPQDVKPDGAYHKLTIELKNGARGTKVTYRPGYYAPQPFGKENGVAKMLSAANALQEGNAAGSVNVNVIAPAYRSATPKAYVPVLIEADGASFFTGADPAATGAVPIEVYAYAMNEAGEVQDYFVQSMGLDPAKAGPALRQTGFKFFGHVELPPGEYALRVVVRNGATGVFGSRVETITVPDYIAGKAILLPPLFPEPGNKWVMVRERPRGEMPNETYPFMVGQQPFVPASMPHIAAGQEVAMSLMGWNWGDGDVKATGRVLSADGHDLGIAPIDIRVMGHDKGSALLPDDLKASFRPPNTLPPGQYQLVIELTTAAGTGSSIGYFQVAAANAAPRG
jgi:VWFA-related protein